MNHVKKDKFTTKRVNLYLTLILLPIALLIALAALFNFYPGGYGITTSNHEVYIDQGAISKETYIVKETENNEVRIGLLKNDIDHLKRLWYVSLLFTGTVLIGLLNFFRLKSKILFFGTLILFISIGVWVCNSYAHDMKFLDNIIEELANR
ncbi:hypothetical protein [Sporosarcina obsidiansis]|uniref:hypothetical protein n=1 Tax=Sporosarcina obsidiansis TaxID=2660748 RepID=UPI00129B2972|nr:hypothetical protein [Sporosarcina obsidiansis]